MNLNIDAVKFALDPYLISVIIFFFVSLNIISEVNTRLIELQAGAGNVTKVRLVWIYSSAAYSYIIKMFLAIFVIFGLLTVFTVLLVATMYVIRGGSTNGSSQSEITSNIKSSIMTAIQNSAMGNVQYMYKYLLDKQALLIYFFILPLIMFMISFAFAITIYKPSISFIDEDDTPKQSIIMETFHHYLFYIFVSCIIGVSIYLLYNKGLGD